MATKLTLSIEKSVIDRAKAYAMSTGRSLSELIENYLISLTEESHDTKLSPKLNKLVGAVKLPPDFDENNELRSYLESKHL